MECRSQTSTTSISTGYLNPSVLSPVRSVRQSYEDVSRRVVALCSFSMFSSLFSPLPQYKMLRPRSNFDAWRDVVIGQYNDGQPNERICARLAEYGVKIGIATLQRRLKDWGCVSGRPSKYVKKDVELLEAKTRLLHSGSNGGDKKMLQVLKKEGHRMVQNGMFNG